MWSQLALCLFVGLAYAVSNPGWKENAEYVYRVQGRTLASLHEVSNQYSGILFKAKLRFQPKSDCKLLGQISDTYYSQIQTNLREFDTHIPEAELSWKTLKISKEPFQVEMDSGVITDIIVNKDLSNWEGNLIKSILSQFQLNTTEAKFGKPSSDQPESAFYTTMEDTITGNVETFYKIIPLPGYLVRSKPWGEKALELKGDGEVFEIMKHKNYTNSIELPAYSHGFGYTYEGFPGTNSIGRYLVRDATSRIFIAGSLQRYTIHHSVTVNRIMANPTLGDKQKGSVNSLMNVTLEEVKGIDQIISPVSQPIRLGNLVYSFGSPYADVDRVHEKLPSQALRRSEMNQKNKMMESIIWPVSQRQRRSVSVGPQSQNYKEDSDSLQQNGSEESFKKSHTPIREAPEEPMLPFSVGYAGLSVKKATDAVEHVKSLSQEISNELQEPKRDLQETLSKFTILSSLMRILNAEEMQKAADDLYSKEQEGPKRDAWQVLRDSIADSGTGPALLTIQKLIQNQKLTNSEAAIVFASMMRSVRQPTLEYMQTAFELVKSNKVQSEAPLNTTALLSYSDLVHKVYMKSHFKKNQYPVKSFRRFNSEEGRKYIKQSVIPYYTKQLEEAISKGETPKIHAFILALGNIAHPDILRTYQPYLEGKKQSSQYQRILMILSLQRLAIHYPEQTREVLFKVYQNTGEIEEVRAAAALYLMYTVPKKEILQYMASYTNVDAHEQVSAIVKNVIEDLSLSNEESLYELRAAAEIAKPLLTDKVYSAQYGFRNYRPMYLKELGLTQLREELVFESPESYIPKGFRFSTTNNLRGNKEHLWNVFGLVSSVDELIHVLKLQTEEHNTNREEQNRKFTQQKQNKWSSQNIASILKLDKTEREQLEGVFAAGLEAPMGMLSFDNRTIERITKEIQKYEQELREGKKMNFVKLFSSGPLTLTFPTEMGLPFLFTRESPTLLRAKGSISATSNPQVYENGKIRKPDSIEIKSKMAVTLSGNREGQLSFITPFDHQQYIAGYDKHWQVSVPITADIDVDVKTGKIKAEIEPSQNVRESVVFQYATHPYTSRIDIVKFQPISVHPHTHPIEQRNIRVYDKIIGEKQTGMAFRVQMRHERRYLTNPKIIHLFRAGAIEGFKGLWNDAEIQQSLFKISHVVPKSTTRKLTVRLEKLQEYYRKAESSWDVSSESDYQKEMMKKAAAGIQSVTSQVLDASFEFQGEQVIKHQLIGAFAKSDVDSKSRVLAEYKMKSDKPGFKPFMASFEANNEAPNTNGLDLEFSFKNEPKVDSDMKLVFGENSKSASKIQASWKLRRSSERKDFLKEQPLYRECQRDQREGNKQTAPCINMTIASNFLDRVNAQFEFEKLSPALENMLQAIYHTVSLEYLPIPQFDAEQSSGSRNEIKMAAAFDPDLRSANISLQTVEGKSMFKDVVVGEWTRQFVVLHPVFHLKARLIGKALGISDYRPFCVVDRSQVKTFNNWALPSEISKEWTVMLQYIPNEARHKEAQSTLEYQMKNQLENYAILVRKNSQNEEKKELKITLSTPQTEFKVLEVTMTPVSSGRYKGKVTVNGQQVQVSDKQSYDLNRGYIQIYGLPNGEIKFEVKGAFYTLYDGERIRVVPSDGKFKSANRGICGQFTNNKFEDLVTPRECFVRDFRKFVKSYEIEGPEGEKVREELVKNGRLCVIKNIPLYINVVSPGPEPKPDPEPRSCSVLQTRYVEESNEICFTTTTVKVCKKRCKPQGTMAKEVPVHCVKKSPAALLWKNAIERGANPDFSHKKVDKTVTMKLPKTCVE